MILNVYVDGQAIAVEVPNIILNEADDFFTKMDMDMDQGWQMSQKWVDELDNRQRCQVVGDKMLTAMENENQQLLQIMAGYILKKLPGISEIHLSTNGDINETEIVMGEQLQ